MKKADVCLILEGTYPFVTGGVSSWVHRLVTRIDDLTFSVLHLSPSRGAYPKGPKYELPPNLVGVREVYLQPEDEIERGAKADSRDWRPVIRRFQGMMRDLREGRSGAFDQFFQAVNEEEDILALKRALLDSPEGWEVMLETYKAEAGEEGLLQFFWTWRFALLPLVNVLTAKLPPARCYHTVCTGYAGILAAGAKLRMNRPMFLTEHGIYAKERRIDIQRASWIPGADVDSRVSMRDIPYFKQFWMRQFSMMSRVCYEHADEIYTLYEGNKVLQVDDGADPERVFVVPNGIDLSRFKVKPDTGRGSRPLTVGFIGRVCPIKDVRTLLRAARLVLDKMPDVRFRVMGPADEDPEYAEACVNMAASLRLGDHVTFDGSVNVIEELPKVDLCVLSSISEAQPLVILEGGAVGVPTVATDVGSCSELLFGRLPADQALGKGGRVVPIYSPGALSEALLEVLGDEELRRQMSRTMRARVETHYDEREMVRRYAEIYRRHAGAKGVA